MFADLVWGFLKGVYFDLQVSGTISEESVNDDLEEIFENLQQRAEVYAASRSQPAGFSRHSMRRGQKNRKILEMANQVEELLKFERKTQVERPSTTDMTIPTKGDVDPPDPFCFDVVYHLIDDAVPEDHPFASAGQTRAFWDRQESLSEFNVEDLVNECSVHSIIDNRQLLQRDRLLSHLEADAEVLKGLNKKGVSVNKALSVVVEKDPVSSEEIAEEIDEIRRPQDYTASVTRLAKDLAGEDIDNRADGIATWKEIPILQGSNGGWEATNYGRAVNHSLDVILATEGEVISLEETRLFPEELLQEALNEVSLKANKDVILQ